MTLGWVYWFRNHCLTNCDDVIFFSEKIPYRLLFALNVHSRSFALSRMPNWVKTLNSIKVSYKILIEELSKYIKKSQILTTRFTTISSAHQKFETFHHPWWKSGYTLFLQRCVHTLDFKINVPFQINVHSGRIDKD